MAQQADGITPLKVVGEIHSHQHRTLLSSTSAHWLSKGVMCMFRLVTHFWLIMTFPSYLKNNKLSQMYLTFFPQATGIATARLTRHIFSDVHLNNQLYFQAVTSSCHLCTSLKSVPTQRHPQSSTPPPDCIDTSFAVDVWEDTQYIYS